MSAIAVGTAARSSWRAAREKLARARQSDWSDAAGAQAAWDQVGAGEQRLLAPALHMPALVEKLRYLLALSQPEGERAPHPTRLPWKLRLLHSAVRDAARLAAEMEQAQRCETLRRHASQLGDQGAVAAQLAGAVRALGEVRAERDAAHAALARLSGVAGVGRPGY